MLVVDAKSRAICHVSAHGMMFYPRNLVLGMGRFQTGVAFLSSRLYLPRFSDVASFCVIAGALVLSFAACFMKVYQHDPDNMDTWPDALMYTILGIFGDLDLEPLAPVVGKTQLVTNSNKAVV